jgi:SAM-dependent methyltransferase
MQKQESFNSYANNYDEALNKGVSLSGENKDYFARERLRWLRARLDTAGVNPKRIMDFGCGIGSATPFIREFFPKADIVGVDLSSDSIDVARSAHADSNIRFETGLESSGGNFDLVFCNGVFHHINPPERGEVCRAIASALNEGGIFAMFENNPWNPGTRMVMAKIPFDKDAITLSPPEAEGLVSKNGFMGKRLDFLFFFPRFLSFFRFLEPLLRSVPLGAQYLVMATKR